MSKSPSIVYCRCAYAQVVADDVKDGVIEGLCASGRSFDAVSDLCEMSARKDSRLTAIAQQDNVRIAACHPRAVKWLFHAAGVPLDDARAEIVNMREETAATATAKLLEDNDY
jgi:heterodisulfide reductase subunit A-like polyferredoxin